MKGVYSSNEVLKIHRYLRDNKHTTSPALASPHLQTNLFTYNSFLGRDHLISNSSLRSEASQVPDAFFNWCKVQWSNSRLPPNTSLCSCWKYHKTSFTFWNLRKGNVCMLWTLKHNSSFLSSEHWFESPYFNSFLCQKWSQCTLWWSSDI